MTNFTFDIKLSERPKWLALHFAPPGKCKYVSQHTGELLEAGYNAGTEFGYYSSTLQESYA